MTLRHVLLTAAVVLSMPLVLRAEEGPPRDRAGVIAQLPSLHLLEPAWASPVVYGESSVLFQEKEGAPLVARLAFPASELLSVKSADGKQTFTLDKDFKLSEDHRTLTFGADVKVPMIKVSDLFVPEGSPNSYRHRVGHPDQNLLYHAGRWFHDRQIEVTYRRAGTDWPGKAPTLAENALPKTFARLRAGEPLTLGVSGDSISAGGDVSGLNNVAPFMPAFPELVAAQLQASYHGDVTLKNRAVGGWSVANGVGDIGKLMAEKPQLIVVAYGMNDVGRRDPKWFKEQTTSLIEKARAIDSNVEIILVAPMLGNGEWIHTPRDMFAKYRDVLAELTGPGIALADLTDAWTVMLAHKHDFDLIGNGLNHPNDCGHRLYAQTILGLLVAPKTDGK